MIVGFVAIAAGLAVLVYSDTILRLVLLDQTASATLRTAATGASGGFTFPTGGFGTGGFGSTGAITGASAASALASASSSTTSIEETSSGFGLAAVGLVLAVVGSRRR